MKQLREREAQAEARLSALQQEMDELQRGFDDLAALNRTLSDADVNMAALVAQVQGLRAASTAYDAACVKAFGTDQIVHAGRAGRELMDLLSAVDAVLKLLAGTPETQG